VASWQAHLAALAVRARMKRRPGAALDAATLAAVRGRLGNGGRPRPAPGADVTPATVGGVRGEWVTPRGARGALPVVLYLHGGGYIAGAPHTHRPLTAALARPRAGLTGARVFAPAYRLAPEHPYPAALDDARAAYRGLLAEGVPPASLAVAGDSAGGGLALATLAALREAGTPLPACAVLFSPWTDLAATGASLAENDRRCAMFYAESIRVAPAAYLAGADPRTPGVSPLYADLAGLPPLLVHAGRDEVLRDDAVRAAARARAAGVTVELTLYDRVPHVWQFWGDLVPEARASLDAAARWVAAHARPAAPPGAPPNAAAAAR
jgi:acetyl esterase/lipase